MRRWPNGARRSVSNRQRRIELERIIQLDPDNATARQALGYRRVNDSWLTRDEAMARRGLKRYAGQYRTAQDIALREEARKQRAAEGEWFKKIKRWRNWLADDRPARFELAEQNLRAIDDPVGGARPVEIFGEKRIGRSSCC